MAYLILCRKSFRPSVMKRISLKHLQHKGWSLVIG